MTDHFFHTDLKLLTELAAEFALANPASAPHLDGNNADPDVDRLLEAVAFQNAMLRRKLHSDFPELVHALTQMILPHYLRPIPATTIIGFTPHTTQGQSAIIPAGAQLASAPVDGAKCTFTTTAGLELHPLELVEASFAQQSGRTGEIRLSLALKGLPLQGWRPATLRLFLAGDHASAAELHLLLSRHVTRIAITPGEGGAAAVLPADCLRAAGFAEGEDLLPYPSHAFPGYRLLQEYFCAPEKFLFVELSGWERWGQRGEGMQFSIVFELDKLPSQPQRIRRESFALHAVPAVNLFSHSADPIAVDHGAGLYRLRPSGSSEPAHCQIFSVDRVTGCSRASARERTYLPLELFSGNNSERPAYQTLPAQSRLHGGFDVDLSVSFPGGMRLPDNETLSIALTCTNGSLPEHLRIGDVAEQLSALPDFVSARNVTPINPGHPPPIGPGLLRQLISHLKLNHQSLASATNLRTLLELYVPPGGRAGSHGAANLKRIAGIQDLEVIAGERTVSGVPVRGREIRIKVRQDHFAGPGDMHLFGCVLDHFLGCCASLNSYTRLAFHETSTGEIWQWPMRLGNRAIG